MVGVLCGDEGFDGLLSVVLQAPLRLCTAFFGSLIVLPDRKHEVVAGGAVRRPIANRPRTSVFSNERISLSVIPIFHRPVPAVIAS